MLNKSVTKLLMTSRKVEQNEQLFFSVEKFYSPRQSITLGGLLVDQLSVEREAIYGMEETFRASNSCI